MFKKLQIKAVCGKLRMQSKINRVLKEEAGGAELIATLVIIGIVMILAFVFKDKISSLVGNLWDKLVVDGSSGITQSTVAEKWN